MNQSIGFLFDNDGVLIDSQALHWHSWQLLMKEDPHLSMGYSTFLEGFGKRNDLILKELYPHSEEFQRKEWEKRKEELFREIAKGKITLLPGMEIFLKQLKNDNIPRIIASSTPIGNLKMYLRDTILGNYFTSFVSAEEVAHGKPFPDIFLEAANRLGIPPQNCIVIEDAPVGITAAKKAGCFVIALETTHPKALLKDADIIYKDPSFLSLAEIQILLKNHSFTK